MYWQQLKLWLKSEELPRIEELLQIAGAQSISLADAGCVQLLESAPGQTPLWPKMILTAIFPCDADLKTLVPLIIKTLQPDASISATRLEEENWTSAWRKKSTTVRHFGKRLAISTLDAPLESSSTVTVKMNPGLAFGTGEHPTTGLCLEWLDRNLPAGARGLDYGCGSGILAIAALRLGARFAWAVDIEKQAVNATKNNATINTVSERIWVGIPTALGEVRVDVLVANILANPLEKLASDFSRFVVPGGSLVISGILKSQTERLEAMLSKWFAAFVLETNEGWVRLSSVRHKIPQ